MYWTTKWIPNQTSKSYRSALDNVFLLYNLAGFNIKYIYCDNEYQSLMNELQEVRMHYANAQEITENLIYRDNQSSMKLETNGKASSSKRTRHFNIKYFFITDLIKQGEVSIKYCPTDAMIAYFMTKPLTGQKFQAFRKAIMNLNSMKQCTCYPAGVCFDTSDTYYISRRKFKNFSEKNKEKKTQ
jgi:hypothetical protein